MNLLSFNNIKQNKFQVETKKQIEMKREDIKSALKLNADERKQLPSSNNLSKNFNNNSIIKEDDVWILRDNFKTNNNKKLNCSDHYNTTNFNNSENFNNNNSNCNAISNPCSTFLSAFNDYSNKISINNQLSRYDSTSYKPIYYYFNSNSKYLQLSNNNNNNNLTKNTTNNFNNSKTNRELNDLSTNDDLLQSETIEPPQSQSSSSSSTSTKLFSSLSKTTTTTTIKPPAKTMASNYSSTNTKTEQGKY